MPFRKAGMGMLRLRAAYFKIITQKMASPAGKAIFAEALWQEQPGQRVLRERGSITSRTASPTRFQASTNSTNAMLGKNTMYQY